MAIRNLLHNKQLADAVLKPLEYPRNTFKVICEIVEAAMLLEGVLTSKTVRERVIRNVNSAVRKLKRIK
jgi:hypothetical protein